jgi:putative flippase GtrA
MIGHIAKTLGKPQSGRGKFLGFLAAGLPSFVMAVLLNWGLVEFFTLPKPLAYALVLIVQVVANFFMCRWFVFTTGMHKTIGRQFFEFFSGIMSFRAADWAVYSLTVQFIPHFFLAVQIFNVLLFSVLKYRFSRTVIEGK